MDARRLCVVAFCTSEVATAWRAVVVASSASGEAPRENLLHASCGVLLPHDRSGMSPLHALATAAAALAIASAACVSAAARASTAAAASRRAMEICISACRGHGMCAKPQLVGIATAHLTLLYSSLMLRFSHPLLCGPMSECTGRLAFPPL